MCLQILSGSWYSHEIHENLPLHSALGSFHSSAFPASLFLRQFLPPWTDKPAGLFLFFAQVFSLFFRDSPQLPGARSARKIPSDIPSLLFWKNPLFSSSHVPVLFPKLINEVKYLPSSESFPSPLFLIQLELLGFHQASSPMVTP